MLFKYIERLRQKSEMERRSYAFGITAVMCLLIAGMWALTSPYDSILHNKTAEETKGPWAAITENISGGYNDVKEKIVGSNPFSEQIAAVGTNASSTDTTASSTPDQTATPSQNSFNEVIISDPNQ
jgi:hypothetical protein